jgi:hypothetical protein
MVETDAFATPLPERLALIFSELHIPDGKDAASLSKARLLLNTSNALLKDGRNLGRGSLGVGGVEASTVDDSRCGISDL